MVATGYIKLKAIEKELLKDTNLTKELVATLAGKDIRMIETMSDDEILHYLCYLCMEANKSELKLHWTHNQSAENQGLTYNAYEKLIKMRKINLDLNKTKEFGTKRDVFEMIRMFSCIISRLMMNFDKVVTFTNHTRVPQYEQKSNSLTQLRINKVAVSMAARQTIAPVLSNTKAMNPL